MKKYVKLKNGDIINTSLPFPHVECYLVIGNKFYFETISGDEIFLDEICKQSDEIHNLLDKEEDINEN